MRATSPWMTRRMIKMEFNGLLQKFLSLRNSDNVVSEAYKVLNISHRNSHKLGYTEDGFPVIFIECSDIRKTSDIRLQLVDVLFNRECSLYSAKEKIENEMIELKLQRTNIQMERIKNFKKSLNFRV